MSKFQDYVKIQVIGILANGVKHIHEMLVGGNYQDGLGRVEEGVKINYDQAEGQWSGDQMLIRHTYTVTWTEVEVVRSDRYYLGVRGLVPGYNLERKEK